MGNPPSRCVVSSRTEPHAGVVRGCAVVGQGTRWVTSIAARVAQQTTLRLDPESMFCALHIAVSDYVREGIRKHRLGQNAPASGTCEVGSLWGRCPRPSPIHGPEHTTERVTSEVLAVAGKLVSPPEALPVQDALSEVGPPPCDTRWGAQARLLDFHRNVHWVVMSKPPPAHLNASTVDCRLGLTGGPRAGPRSTRTMPVGSRFARRAGASGPTTIHAVA